MKWKKVGSTKMMDRHRRALLELLGDSIWSRLQAQGATEAGILQDFEAFRKCRNRALITLNP